MAEEAAIPRDGPSAPAAPAGLLARILGAMNALGTLWIIGLMVLINVDIFGRSVLSRPIAGVPELVAFSIVGIVFLQLAHTLRSGSMTRSDVLLNVLERRAPRARLALLGLFHLAGGSLLALVAWKFWPSVTQAWWFPQRHFMGNPGFFTIPQWPLFALMFSGIVATSVQFLVMALESIALLGWADIIGLHLARLPGAHWLPRAGARASESWNGLLRVLQDTGLPVARQGVQRVRAAANDAGIALLRKMKLGVSLAMLRLSAILRRTRALASELRDSVLRGRAK
jgi:TRAP-type C4-dicarboxylate transport system permease small subunit